MRPVQIRWPEPRAGCREKEESIGVLGARQSGDLAPLVPSLPSLRGVTAYPQGAAIDLALPKPLELTSALAVILAA